MSGNANLEEVFLMARQLTPADKVRLIEKIAPHLAEELAQTSSRTRKSLYGLCSDLGPAPSEEEIDKLRREEWTNFPRGDI